MNKSELSRKTVQELRALAKASGLKGFSALRKAELVALLAAAPGSGRADSRTHARDTGKKVAAAKKPAGAAARKPADAGAKKPARAASRKPASAAAKKSAGS